MPQRLPDPLPEAGNFRMLYAWLNQLRGYVASLTPKKSATMDISHTSSGVLYRPRGTSTTTPPAEGLVVRPLGMVFRGEFAPDLDYEPGDTVSIFGGGTAGMWVCLLASPAGAAAPGEPGSSSWLKVAAGFVPDVWS